MLQEFFSIASNRKAPTSTPLATPPQTPSPPSNPASSSSSFASPSPDLDYLPVLPWDRRHSSSSITSDTSEDELETPPTSPRPRTLPLPDAKQNPMQPLDLLHYPFSIAEICEEEANAREPSFDWITPSDSSNLPQLLHSISPSSTDILSPSLPPASPSPSSPPAIQSQSYQPTRQEEETSRGRSRAPRLLWRSSIDKPSLDVLNRYHEQIAGVPLPRLKEGMGRREVREWSKRVEELGI